MTSSSAPTYYFSGILFNNSFYQTVSYGVSIGTANALYLRKKTADTATALETFSAGVQTPSIQSSSSPMNLFTTNSLPNTLNLGNSNMTLKLNCALVPQDLTYSSPSQIGWTQGLTFFTDTAFSGTGDYQTKTSQSITTGTQLPIGVYLMTFSASTTIGAGISATVSTAGVAYYNNNTAYGGSSGIVQVENTFSTNHPLLAKTSGEYYWTFSKVIPNVLPNGYLYASIYWFTSTALTGTVQHRITSFSITRIA